MQLALLVLPYPLHMLLVRVPMAWENLLGVEPGSDPDKIQIFHDSSLAPRSEEAVVQ